MWTLVDNEQNCEGFYVNQGEKGIRSGDGITIQFEYGLWEWELNLI